MNNSQLTEFLKNILDNFKVIPYDFLPDISPRNFFYIINTHNSNLPGEHWQIIYISNDSFAHFFDSFGRNIENNFVKKFINKNCSRIIANRKQIQNHLSEVCGIYCIVFIIFIYKGFNITDFINIFTSNYYINDEIIKLGYFWKFSKSTMIIKKLVNIPKHYFKI